MNASMPNIPLSRPAVTGRELDYIGQALQSGQLAGDGPFGRRCEGLLHQAVGRAALLTPSCTAALELAALVLGLQPGDEVVMPSFTFPSTANAFVLRGCTPVFCDIRTDTLNLDERLLEQAFTPRTKAVVVVHYAGNPAAMASINAVCRPRGIAVIEDAAQALGASLDGVAAGALGDMAAFSFHATKNIGCGEGGALMLPQGGMLARAEILREKGTDRSRFLRCEVDRYSWQDIGSSYVVSELQSAALLAQLESLEEITRQRVAAWDRYLALLEPLEREGWLTRPTLTPGARHNAHLFPVQLCAPARQAAVLAGLLARGVAASAHYVPLHEAPAGRRFGRVSGDLGVTERASRAILRLPLWAGIDESVQRQVTAALAACLVR